MIHVGIDSIDIYRFNHWISFSHKKLLRIYSHEELSYCCAVPIKTAERLAVRFAAKEAFYKAIFPLLRKPLSVFTVAKQCSVSYTAQGNPELLVTWSKLEITPRNLSLSLTHSTTIATAIVIVT